MDEVAAYNRKAWDRQVSEGNAWTVPVGPEAIAAARNGDVQVVLTPQKPVPRDWLGTLQGQRVLGLASAGGQQMPLFAAAGAQVTVIDNSPAQLGQDAKTAGVYGLEIRTELGDMRDLSRFADGSFDLVFHPVSNCFVPDIQTVWNEVARVLAPGGVVLAGFCNPVLYATHPDAGPNDPAELVFSLPHSERDDLPPEVVAGLMAKGEPLGFSHSLEAQIGGQCAAGLRIAGLYEDRWNHDLAIARLMPLFIATRAIKPL